VEQLLSISVFLAMGLGMVVVGLGAGALLRPKAPNPEKLAIYECGEPAIGTSWVQFDLRFYIVALFYLVFDVEVALIYPWAVVFREAAIPALLVGAPFMLIIVIGYAYEWKCGSLEWIRSQINTSRPGNGVLSAQARRDPETLLDERDASVSMSSSS